VSSLRGTGATRRAPVGAAGMERDGAAALGAASGSRKALGPWNRSGRVLCGSLPRASDRRRGVRPEGSALGALGEGHWPACLLLRMHHGKPRRDRKVGGSERAPVVLVALFLSVPRL
jgi:hypothetical protein